MSCLVGKIGGFLLIKTSEEGARFPQCMMASGVWAGATDVEKVHQIADIADANVTVKSELTRIGYLGETKADWRATPFAAHFELHIGMKLLLVHNLKTDGDD